MKKPFHHTTNIRQDERIAHLIANHGHAGYGIYWMIIEMLHSEENMQIEYSSKKMTRMAALIGMKDYEFTDLLRAMINEYDLLEVVDRNTDARHPGYLRSAIAYRKPRKPKPAITAADTPQENASNQPVPGTTAMQNNTTSETTTKEAGPQSSDEQTAPEEQSAPDDMQLYEGLMNYIDKNAPQVNTFKEPLTVEQVVAIRTNYDEELILFVLEDMQQTKELGKQHNSAYHAFQLFAENFVATQ